MVFRTDDPPGCTNWASSRRVQSHAPRIFRVKPWAELLAFGLELLVEQPDDMPLRQLIKMNAADLVTFVQHADRPLVLPAQSSVSADVSQLARS
jgi:hypothetical protein